MRPIGATNLDMYDIRRLYATSRQMAKFPEHGTTAGASNLLRGRGRTSSSPWLEDTEEKESATTLLTRSDDKNSGRPSRGIPSLHIAERGEEEVPQRRGEGGRAENEEEVTAAAAKFDQHQSSFRSSLSPPPDIFSPLPSPAVPPGLGFEKGGGGGRSLSFSPPGILSPVPVPSASDIFSSSSSSSRQHVIAIGGSGERSPPLPPPREALFSPPCLLSSTPPLVGPRLATYPSSSSSSTLSSISRSPPLLQQQQQHRPQLLCLPRNVVSNNPADNTKGRKTSPDQCFSSLIQDLSVSTSSATPALTLLPWPESPCSYGGSPASAGGGNVPTLHPNIVVTNVAGALLGMPSYVLHNGVRSRRAGPATGLRCSGPSSSVPSSSSSSVVGAAGSVVGASPPSSSFYTGAIDTVQMLVLCMRSFTSFDELRHAAASTTITSAFNPAGSLSNPPLTHTFNTLAAIADHAMHQIEPKIRPASPAEVAIMTTLRDEILTWRLWASVYFTNQPDHAFERGSTLVDWARALCEPFACERKGETGGGSGSCSSRPMDNEQSSPPMLSLRIYLQHFLGLVHTMEGYCPDCDFSFTASTLEPEYCCPSVDPPSLSLNIATRTENPGEALRTGLLTDTWSVLPPAVTASFVKTFTMKHCIANLMHEKEGGERHVCNVCNHLERKDKEQFAFAAAMLPFSSTGVAPCPFFLLDVVDGSLEAARRTIVKSLDLGRTVPGDGRRYNNKYRLCGVVYRVDNPCAPRGPQFVSECQVGDLAKRKKNRW